MKTANEWIKQLGLAKHPEGGYYKEIYRSKEIVAKEALPSRYEASHAFATSIYFLIKSGEPSRFHRLKSDEIWYYHAGEAITIYIISPKGNLEEKVLGGNIDQGENLQVIIPQGSWFGAEVNISDSYGLMGCMVAPGFEFNDFELGNKNELLKQFSQYQPIIEKLT